MGTNILYALLYLFLAPVGGGLLAGLDRKLAARMQRRVGPPVVQPFYDVLKLFEKERIAVNEAQGFYLAGFLFILQIKFRKSPFDLSMSHEIHQELVQGIKTEFSGGMLALFEIAEWYEKIFLLGFVYLFFKWRDPWSGVTGILVCAAVLFLSTLVDNCTARMKWRHLLGSAWLVTLVAGFINIVFLMYIR